MGNGDEASGDGWTYRGRGLIQITGKANYTLFANDTNQELDQVIPFLETIEGAVMSAGWYWNKNNLNDLADQSNFNKITQVINGGLNGLPERKAILNKVMSVFNT